MKSILKIFVWSSFALVTLEGSAKSAVEQMIAKNGLKSHQVSILIKDIKRGKTLVSINPNTSRKPASVMKLFTTYGALLDLGGSFRWPTKIYYSGNYNNGEIDGDLIIKPYGDPTLSSRDVPKIIERLHALGVNSITGDIVIDRSFFVAGKKINSGFDKNRFSEYNAMPDAMMLDDHLSEIEVLPEGGSIVARKLVPDSSYRIVNKLKATDSSCKGKYSWPRVGVEMHEKASTVVTLSGTLSTKCRKRVIKKVLSHPYNGMYNLCKEDLDKSDIEFHGNLVLDNRPEDSRLLFTHYSKKDLFGIVSKTNKKSNNLYARHLLLIQGAKAFGTPATLQKGREAVIATLKDKGEVELPKSIVLDNGSGLSRKSRVTAKALSDLLLSAYNKFGTKWLKALSIAGTDGTIKKRFARSPAKNRAWMKTGTLNDAKNIAGYVRAKSSKKLYSVVILYNGHEKWKGSQLQNQIINWLAK